MVFYRKYRPQTFDEIIGQRLVKENLISAINAGKLAHAYLFYGPRGSGKTSTARILAKVVNCELAGQPTATPCNKCPSCIAITNGTHLDVIEMDAASNRGIEDIRVLRDNIKLAPSGARKKVYIIDEVHQLSGDAFNALLKTLEEPPDHVLFILATTEIQKIPATILSRVQRLDFKPAALPEVVEDLKRIVEKEKINIDEEALLTLAAKSQGSFRDAEKYLDQLSGYRIITSQVVEEHIGGGSIDEGITLLGHLVDKDPEKSLGLVVSWEQSSIRYKEMNLVILDLLRQMVLIKNNLGEKLVKAEVGEEKFGKINKLAEKISLEGILKMVSSFQKSLENFRFSVIPALPLEVAVVESCIQEVQSEDASRQEEDKLKEDKVSRNIDKIAAEDKKEESLGSEIKTDNQSSDIQKITDRWSYILETVKQYNYSLEALLKSSKVVNCDEKAVVIEVPYSFHQRILEAPKSKELLESILSDILGRSVKATTVLGKRTVKAEDLVNIELAADDEIVRIASEIFNSDSLN